MSEINIQTATPGLSWRFGGTFATLRIYANQTFVTSDGIVIQQNTYKSVTCTVSGTTLEIPSFTLDSTTNSSNPYANYTAYLYDHRGVKRWQFPGNLSSFQLDFDTLGVSTSWELIIDYNSVPPPTFFNYPEIVTIISNMVTQRLLPVANAARLVLGKTALSADPLNAAFPIAVAENDDVWQAIEKTVYLSEFASLDAALDYIDSQPVQLRTTLKITSNCPVTANTVIPENVLVDIEAEGRFTVSSGQTLEISAFKDCGNRRAFYGAGKVIFNKNAVTELNLTWWTGTVSTANHQLAFECARDSLIANEGGILLIPAGVWKLSGNIALPNSTIVEGVGCLSDSGAASVVKLDGTNDTNIFNVGDNFRNITLRDVVLDCGTQTGCIGFVAEGEEPDSGFGLKFEGVTFYGGEFGMSINADDNSWEVINVMFDHCQFLGQTVANYRCQTVNNSTMFLDCLLQATNGVDCLKLESSGKLTVIGTTFLGVNAACVDGDLNPAVMAGKVCHITGQQVGITFIGCQDEGFLRFIVNEVSDITYPINLIGNIIQSKMELLESCVVTSRGNRYHADSWIVDSAAAIYVLSEFDHIRPLNLCNVVRPPVLADFSDTGTIFAVENSYDQTLITNRFPTRFLSPKALDGNPTTPVAAFGHYTEVSENKILARFGRTDIEGVFDFYYDFYRNYTNGRLHIEGNQTATPGAVGIDFNGDISAQNFRVGEVAPAQINGTQNNWNPGSSDQHILVTTDASRTITGMTFDFAQEGGDVRIIQNLGANPLVIAHQNGDSASGNRFLCVTGANITVLPNELAICVYDGTTRRWRTFGMKAYQPLDTELTAIGGLTSAADKGIQFTGAGTAGTYDLTAAGRALLDDADAAAQLVTLGLNATAAEINQFNDVSAYQETLADAGALSVTKIYSKLALAGAGAVTLAVPDASMLGQTKTIEMTADNGAVTLALTNIEGQSSGTTCEFNDVGDKLILVAGVSKWVVIREIGVTMS